MTERRRLTSRQTLEAAEFSVCEEEGETDASGLVTNEEPVCAERLNGDGIPDAELVGCELGTVDE